MKKQREQWGSRLGFILASAGSAIGLGTLWLFPYVTGQNGGGLFVLLYYAFTLLLGVPLFVTEVVLGRYAQRGAVGVFAHLAPHSPKWRIVGWLGVAASFLIFSYYTVIAGWGLNYILMSLNQFWRHCSPDEVTAVFQTLSHASDITLFWHVAFTALTGLVVLQGVRKGIEQWGRIMTTALLFLLIGLFAYSLTLPGFDEALHFVFWPNTSRLKPSGALEALGLAFYTMSLAQGIMLTYGSYMKRDANVPQTAGVVAIMLMVVSVLAALMIFPITFSYGRSPEEGPGLVFKTLPIIFSQLPGGLLLSIAFFVLFVFTGLTSSIALVEVVVANCMDLWGWTRKKSVFLTCIASAIVGIPSALSWSQAVFPSWELLYGRNFFDTMNQLVGSWLIPLGGFLTSLFAGWVIPKKVLYREFMAGSKASWLFYPWRFILRWIIPLATLAILFYQSGLLSLKNT